MVAQRGLGRALGDHPTQVEPHDPVRHRGHEREVVLDEQEAGAGGVADRRRRSPSASVSRCAMPADGSSRSTTLGATPIWQVELDDAATSGRELRHELVAERGDAHALDELVGAPAEPRSTRATVGSHTHRGRGVDGR